MEAQTKVQELKSPQRREETLPDTRVDMFSTRGFALAQRIASAFASSDAVPAQFRSHVLKKSGNTEQWVENPGAMGNCIVAIEVAQAVGMSITAVMQNADVIEGKLRWSGKFVIAAINASRRFTPLRFDVKNLGNITAAYKEKGAWNNESRRYNMIEKTVDIENLQCIAWALPCGMPFPNGVYTLDQARAAKLPVIESAPVTMKLAVEECWYSKPGSKWQTEMKHLMLQYRAGTFFGNIHAPDIVMGMGRTIEEERDIIETVRQADGSFSVGIESLRGTESAAHGATIDQGTGEIIPPDTTAGSSAQTLQGGAGAAASNPSEAGSPAAEQGKGSGLTYAQLAERFQRAKDVDVLDADATLISEIADEAQREELSGLYRARREEIVSGGQQAGGKARRERGSLGVE